MWRVAVARLCCLFPDGTASRHAPADGHLAVRQVRLRTATARPRRNILSRRPCFTQAGTRQGERNQAGRQGRGSCPRAGTAIAGSAKSGNASPTALSVAAAAARRAGRSLARRATSIRASPTSVRSAPDASAAAAGGWRRQGEVRLSASARWSTSFVERASGCGCPSCEGWTAVRRGWQEAESRR